MDFHVPNSDDEGHAIYTSRGYGDSVAAIDKVYSDDDDEMWALPSNRLPVQATPRTAPPPPAPERRFTFGRRPTLTGGGATKSSRPTAGGRRLVSNAVAERRAAAAAQAQQEQEQENTALQTIDWPLTSTSQPVLHHNCSLPAFIGRTPPASLKPMPVSTTTTTTATARETSTAPRNPIRSSTLAHAGRSLESGSSSLGRQPDELSAHHRPSSTTAGGGSSDDHHQHHHQSSTGMREHVNDDGMTVLINQRKRCRGDIGINNEDDMKEGGGKAINKKKPSVNSGWGNNFVRIDMKKGRGSTKFRPSRHSNVRRRGGGGRGRWKTQRLRQVGDGAEFMEGWESKSGTTCFKCNGKGHWAKDCPGVENIDDNESGSEDDDEDGGGGGRAPLPSLLPPLPSLLDVDRITGPPPPLPSASEIDLHIDVEALCETESLESNLQRGFGFSAFRGLQLDTIRKVLRGESCLSIMPTGMGKSLCYQLPALLLPGLTLVVSPLIALMHDQCKAAPKELNPAVLWSGQTLAEARQVLRDVETGVIRVLFISPERLGNPYLLAALRPRMPLPLVVIDEAHCVAEWGHSFRPAYFRLGEALQRDISTRCVLALTATATKATEAAVCSVLRIPQTQVLRDSAIRQNLRLQVLRSNGTPCSSGGAVGWQPIVSLYHRSSGILADSRSSIVYCAWKSDADSLASALIGAGVNAKAYHAGRNLKERATIEAAFASRRLRVVVATVAFGMGIDIASVDSVVHATMPRSLEEYVQQIGRAGRDGSEGRCFSFLSDQDFISLRSLSYSGMVTKEAVKTVVSHVFAEKSEESAGERQFGVINCRKLAAEVDMQEESIEAILGYLEADENPYVRVLPKVALAAKVSFYAAAAETMAEDHAVVRAVLSLCPRPRNGLYSISTSKLADATQKEPGAALQELQALAHKKLIGFEFPREMGPGFEILRQPEDLEEMKDSLHARLSTMLRCQVARLDTSYRSLAAAVVSTSQEQQEATLREALEEYFARQEVAGLAGGGVVDPCAPLDLVGLPLRHEPENMLQAAKAALRRNKEQGGPSMTSMALARVLHGTGSAAIPRDVWSKRMGAFWGTMKNVDFTAVVRICRVACNSFAASFEN